MPEALQGPVAGLRYQEHRLIAVQEIVVIVLEEAVIVILLGVALEARMVDRIEVLATAQEVQAAITLGVLEEVLGALEM